MGKGSGGEEGEAHDLGRQPRSPPVPDQVPRGPFPYHLCVSSFCQCLWLKGESEQRPRMLIPRDHPAGLGLAERQLSIPFQAQARQRLYNHRPELVLCFPRAGSARAGGCYKQCWPHPAASDSAGGAWELASLTSCKWCWYLWPLPPRTPTGRTIELEPCQSVILGPATGASSGVWVDKQNLRPHPGTHTWWNWICIGTRPQANCIHAPCIGGNNWSPGLSAEPQPKAKTLTRQTRGRLSEDPCCPSELAFTPRWMSEKSIMVIITARCLCAHQEFAYAISHMYYKTLDKTSLVVQWLRLSFPCRGAQVWSLVEKLRPHLPHGKT